MIKARLKKILKERLGEVNDFNVVNYNAKEDLLEDMVGELSLLPLGIDRKAVVIDYADFLAEGGNKEYLARFNEETPTNDETIDIIYILRSDKILKSSELYKRIEKDGQVINFVNLTKDEWPAFIKKYFNDRGVKIEPKAILEMYDRIDEDLTRFINEANKLILYTNNITLSDVTLMVSKPIEDDVFQLSNALFRRDNATALSIYHDLQLLGSKATDSLIPMLASQFRFINEVRYLSKKGYEQNEMCQILKIKSPYRIKIALQNASKLGSSAVTHALDDLYFLDYRIKSGKIDKNYGFELFLTNFPN